MFEAKNVIARPKEHNLVGEAIILFESIITSYSEKLEKILKEPVYRFATVTSRRVPKEPGVYLIHDDSLKQIIYAGRSRNLRTRLLQQHKKGNVRGSQFRKALGQKHYLSSEAEISAYIKNNCSFQFLPVDAFEEMVRLEHFVTAILAPTLNTELKQ
jgi:excinuclease UvrABC nuclease subunit